MKKQFKGITFYLILTMFSFILMSSGGGGGKGKGRIVKTITKRIENNEIHLLKKNTFYQKLLSFL
jgi:uridine kinase